MYNPQTLLGNLREETQQIVKKTRHLQRSERESNPLLNIEWYFTLQLMWIIKMSVERIT